MDCHRIAPRRRVLKTGSIEFGGTVIDCTVRNISETGAALEIRAPLYIPERFSLTIVSEQLMRRCRVVWHRGTRIGVAFDGTLGSH